MCTKVCCLFATVFIVVQGASINNLDTPSINGIASCSIHQPDLHKCITDNLNIIIPALAKGWGEEIPPMDPLFLPVSETSYEDGNMTLSIDFKNVSISGLSSTRVYLVRAKSIEEGKLEIVCKTPKIIATGLYRSEGALISFPLYSSGPFNITLGDITSHLVINLETVKGHLTLTDIGLSSMPLVIDIEAGRELDDNNDLGNLGKTLSIYLNENAFELYEVVRPRLSDFFSDLIKNIGNNMLQHFESELIFPNLNLKK